MIISPTNSEPFLRLDDIFMKKSDDRVISHIYQMQQDMQAHQGGVFTFTAADGTELVLSYRPLMSFDWVLLTLVPANLISYDTDKYILQTYMIISGTVVFFALILAFLFRIYRNHYKELEEIGLAAPQTTYLMQELKKQGADVNTDATTEEEAAD